MQVEIASYVVVSKLQISIQVQDVHREQVSNDVLVLVEGIDRYERTQPLAHLRFIGKVGEQRIKVFPQTFHGSKERFLIVAELVFHVS